MYFFENLSPKSVSIDLVTPESKATLLEHVELFKAC